MIVFSNFHSYENRFLGSIGNKSLQADIKFNDYLVGEKRTCAGEGMIGNPIRSLTMAKCYEKCKENDKCMYFFFTKQCMSGQVCNKPISPDDSGKRICKSEAKTRQPTGCCALFNKCERSGHINIRGHTCSKCYQK